MTFVPGRNPLLAAAVAMLCRGPAANEEPPGPRPPPTPAPNPDQKYLIRVADPGDAEYPPQPGGFTHVGDTLYIRREDEARVRAHLGKLVYARKY